MKAKAGVIQTEHVTWGVRGIRLLSLRALYQAEAVSSEGLCRCVFMALSVTKKI